MQVLFIWLIFCGQVYELPKRKTGCNYRESSELQPVIKIQLFRGLFLYCSLCDTDIDLIFKYLTASCKPTVSEYLSNIVLINDSQLRGYPQ